jgi:hypothetical protein|tara:strand:+ start:397 stop:603 length:207 start_codon:yes stop_codon:yes gene_type:complete
MNRDKHIYEGWTVGGFIDELEPIFDIITKDKTRFSNRNELADWVMDMQPYYKKHIPEVFRYFLNKTEL